MTRQTEKGRTNKLIRVTVKIRPGHGTPAARTLYRIFLAKLISQAKDALKNENSQPQ